MKQVTIEIEDSDYELLSQLFAGGSQLFAGGVEQGLKAAVAIIVKGAVFAEVHPDATAEDFMSLADELAQRTIDKIRYGE